jgi:hypothetical protein
MLRATDFGGASFLAPAGVFALVGVALKAFMDRVQPGMRAIQAPITRLPREVPLRPAKTSTPHNGQQAS